ncbi:MAG TPA: hypothetical protein VHD32_12665 [Candidatus Didemnitutus sp.]|nr:hypothetical protein [Candidatus Didemnitutus sp.]
MTARPNSHRLLGGILTLALLAGRAFAAEDAAPTSPAPPKDSPPVWDGVRFLTPSSTVYENNPIERKPQTWVFFPPVPPPLGTELRVLPPFVSGRPAPAGVDVFAGDLFYPVLALRLAANDLPLPLADRLEAYRASKASQVNELRATLAAVQTLDANARAARLAEFARAQAPALEELERTAEKLRLDLQGSNVLGRPAYSVDWELSAAWRYPGTSATRERDARALRGAAYFQEGLPPAQRRLLLERAAEIDAAPGETTASGANSSAGWPVNLSPETARLRFISNLPAPLAGHISAYVTEKSAQIDALVAALRSALQTEPSARAAALKHFSEAQVPALERLETAADQIRSELAQQPDPPGPPAPPALPAELAEQINRYHQHKVEVLRTLYDTLARGAQAPEDATPAPVTAADRTPDWLRRGTPATPVAPKGLHISVDEFNQLQLDLIGRLNRELAGLRLALAAYARQGGRKSVDDLLGDFERARQEEENWERYRDYHTAILQPGLSPAQRRLLFDAAIQQLKLPLPAAENIE